MTTQERADYLFALGCLKLAAADLTDMLAHVDEDKHELFASIVNRVDDSADLLNGIYQKLDV